MRRPTPIAALMAWHAAAMAGDRPPIHEGQPQCGFFKTKQVKDGPFVPARIWIDRDIDPETGELTRDERFACEVDGERCSAYSRWTWLAGNPISKADFDALTERRKTITDMAATHAPFDIYENVIRP